MNLPVPQKGLDVRKLRPYVERLTNLWNNFTVIINQTDGVGSPSGELVKSEANAILKLNLKPGGGSGGGGIQPFQIIDKSNSTDGTQVRIVTSAINNKTPSGFTVGDTPNYIMPVSDGDIIYAEIYLDTSDDSSRPMSSTLPDITAGSSIPDDDPKGGTIYRKIGSISVSSGKTIPVNDAFGPFNFVVGRNPFVAHDADNAWDVVWLR